MRHDLQSTPNETCQTRRHSRWVSLRSTILRAVLTRLRHNIDQSDSSCCRNSTARNSHHSRQLPISSTRLFCFATKAISSSIAQMSSRSSVSITPPAALSASLNHSTQRRRIDRTLAFGGLVPNSRSSRYALQIVSRAASVNSAGGNGGERTHLSNGVSASSFSQVRFLRRVRYRSSFAARSAAAFALLFSDSAISASRSCSHRHSHSAAWLA